MKHVLRVLFGFFAIALVGIIAMIGALFYQIAVQYPFLAALPFVAYGVGWLVSKKAPFFKDIYEDITLGHK